jgi:hypothetical protein
LPRESSNGDVTVASRWFTSKWIRTWWYAKQRTLTHQVRIDITPAVIPSFP